MKDPKKLLEIDKMKNINLYNFYIDYNSELTFINNSIILRGTSDNPWVYISLYNEKDLEEVLSNITNDDKFIMVQDRVLKDYFTNNYKMDWILECEKLIHKSRIDDYLNNDRVIKLEPDDAEYIHSKNAYGEYTNIKYIRERIEKGMMSLEK